MSLHVANYPASLMQENLSDAIVQDHLGDAADGVLETISTLKRVMRCRGNMGPELTGIIETLNFSKEAIQRLRGNNDRAITADRATSPLAMASVVRAR